MTVCYEALAAGDDACSFEMTSVYWRHWMPFTNCHVACLTCRQETSEANWCVKNLLVCLFVCMCASFSEYMNNCIVCTWIQYLWACACIVWAYCTSAWSHCVNVCEFLPRGWSFSTLEFACPHRRSSAIPLPVLWSQRGSRGTDTGIKACLFAFVPLCGGHQRLP